MSKTSGYVRHLFRRLISQMLTMSNNENIRSDRIIEAILISKVEHLFIFSEDVCAVDGYPGICIRHGS